MPNSGEWRSRLSLPENFYAHPIFVHFPQGLFPVAFASFLLYLATGSPDFETGAFVAAGFGAAGTLLFALFGRDLKPAAQPDPGASGRADM